MIADSATKRERTQHVEMTEIEKNERHLWLTRDCVVPRVG